MLAFTTKLDMALMAITEMAKLNKWAVELDEFPTIGWQYFLPIPGYKYIFQQIYKPDRQEADREFQERLDTERDRWLSDNPGQKEEDFFKFNYGLSRQEIFNKLKINPISHADINKRDRHLIKSVKTRQKIEDYLNANPAGYQWNFIFLDYDESNSDEDIKNIISDLNIETDNHITFVKTRSSGDRLDADMILHTVGHAILDNTINKEHAKTIDHLLHSFNRWYLKHCNKYYDVQEDSYLYSISRFLHFNAAKNIHKVKTMPDGPQKRYLTKRTLVDTDELIYELAGIFVKRNKVRFSPNEFCDHVDDAVVVNAQRIEGHINDILKQALDNCVGEIIFD